MCWAKLPGTRFKACPECRQKQAAKARKSHWKRRGPLAPKQRAALVVVSQHPARWWQAGQVGLLLWPEANDSLHRVNLNRQAGKLTWGLARLGLLAAKAARRNGEKATVYRLTAAGAALLAGGGDATGTLQRAGRPGAVQQG